MYFAVEGSQPNTSNWIDCGTLWWKIMIVTFRQLELVNIVIFVQTIIRIDKQKQVEPLLWVRLLPYFILWLCVSIWLCQWNYFLQPTTDLAVPQIYLIYCSGGCLSAVCLRLESPHTPRPSVALRVCMCACQAKVCLSFSKHLQLPEVYICIIKEQVLCQRWELSKQIGI